MKLQPALAACSSADRRDLFCQIYNKNTADAVLGIFCGCL